MYDGLFAIEKEVGLRRVGVAVAVALQEAERHQRVEEVARRTRMQAEAPAQGLEGLRAAAPAR